MFDKSSGQFNLRSYRHKLKGCVECPAGDAITPRSNYTQVNKGSFCPDGNAAPVEKAKFAFELAEPILYYMNDLNTRPTFVSGDRSGAYV